MDDPLCDILYDVDENSVDDEYVIVDQIGGKDGNAVDDAL